MTPGDIRNQPRIEYSELVTPGGVSFTLYTVMEPMPKPATFLVISGPSCSGKDTLLSALLAARTRLGKPVTTTTRPPRPNEIDGVHYHFLSRDEFEWRRDHEDTFIETAQIHGHLYGSTHQAIRDVQATGRIPAVILDVQGAMAVAAAMPVATVYVTATDLREIFDRIRLYRPVAEIEARLATTLWEEEQKGYFDHVLLNDAGQEGSAARALIDLFDREIAPRFPVKKATRRFPSPIKR